MNTSKTQKTSRLTLIKVKGHTDKGNINVDKLAKEGCSQGKLITPHRQLIKHSQIPKTLGIATFITNNQIQKWNDSIVLKRKNNSTLLTSSNHHSTSEIQNDIPTTKICNLRNMYDGSSHMRTIKPTHTCPKCNCTGTIEHYSTRCKLLSEERLFAKQQITKLLND